MMEPFHINKSTVSFDTLIHILHTSKQAFTHFFWHTHSNGVSDGFVYLFVPQPWEGNSEPEGRGFTVTTLGSEGEP